MISIYLQNTGKNVSFEIELWSVDCHERIIISFEANGDIATVNRTTIEYALRMIVKISAAWNLLSRVKGILSPTLRPSYKRYYPTLLLNFTLF